MEAHSFFRSTVLVNRGVLPRNAAPSDIPSLPDTATVIRDREERPSIFAVNLNIKSWKTISDALHVRATEAVKVIADETTPPQAPLKIPKLAPGDIPNRHLEYIVTWYSLAVLSSAMSILFKRQTLKYR